MKISLELLTSMTTHIFHTNYHNIMLKVIARGIMVGDPIPDISLPLVSLISSSISIKTINLQELTRGKSTLLIGHPGAFTNFSTNEQIPDYRSASLPYQILFWSVNDPYVVKRYIEKYQIEFPMLCDFNGVLTRTLELGLPEDNFFAFCCRRAICMVDNAVVLGVSLEQTVQYTQATKPSMAQHLSQVIFNH